jgi:hypothetical protein
MASKNVPVAPGNAPLPTLQDDDFGRGLGEPSANDRGGSLIMGVAQTGSDALIENSARFIAGLEPGDIFVPNAVNPVYKDGVSVIPCYAKDTFVEWPPGRQGNLVEVHDKCPDDVERHAGEKGRRPVLIRRSTSNVVEPTRELYLLLLPELLPCILPCWSSRLTFARNWRIWMMQQRDQNGRQLPAYCRRYRLRTAITKNGLGRWHGLVFEDEGAVTNEQLAAGREFSRFVEGGNMRITGSIPDAH